MAKFEVILQTQPKKYYQKVDSKTAKSLEKCFCDLEDNPFYKPGKIKCMKGHAKLFRYNTGCLRVVYEINDNDKKIGVLLIGQRGDIYKKL